jgi:phospholipid-translocating ATPase
VEDVLQDRATETIKSIKEAGIKIWTLTGDCLETAVNVGFSCNLLD